VIEPKNVLLGLFTFLVLGTIVGRVITFVLDQIWVRKTGRELQKYLVDPRKDKENGKNGA
jgi:hypothetical protein